jgi:hypothetical protein
MATRLLTKLMMVGGVFVLSILMFVQSATGGQNAGNNPTNQEIIISEVLVDIQGLIAPLGSCAAGDETITVLGENFDNGDAPVVLLGDQGQLTVCAASATTIVASCPGGICPNGDFLVSVATGPAVKDYDEYDLTIVGLARFEASCADGSALKAIDPDGIPQSVCTDEFALDTELADEIQARQDADAILQININNEATARVAADAALQTNINNEATDRAAADAALQTNIDNEATAREAGDQHSGDVSGPNTNLQIQPNTVGSAEIIDSQVQRRVSSSCSAGSSIRVIDSTGTVTCEPDTVGGGIGPLTISNSQVTVGGLSASIVTLTCGSPTKLISGGCVDPGGGNSIVHFTGPLSSTAWQIKIENVALSSKTYNCRLICVTP